MSPWIVIALAAAAPAPPLLLDPLGAVEQLSSEEVSERRAAEVLLLTGHPREARARLPADPADPRALRLLADAYVDEVLAAPGFAALDALGKHPGWNKHARYQRARLERRVWERRGARFGLGCFALCLAILGLSGARELLRVHPETVALALCGGLATALASSAGPAPSFLAALLAGSWLSLGHSATAAARRLRPGPRGRLFLVTLLLFGVVGAVIALIFTVGVGPLLGGLSGGVPGKSG